MTIFSRSCICIVLFVALWTRAATSAVINVQSPSIGIQWPTPTPSAPPANGSVRSTGANLSLPLFNPTQGFLTQVDLRFNFATGYGGTVSNFSTSSYTGRIVSANGTTGRFDMAPFGTLWNFSAPAEGSTAEVAVASFRSSSFVSSPTPTHSSPTYTFIAPNQLQNFIGIGNTLNLSASQFYTFNLGVSPAQANVSVGTFQRGFFPRAFATYTYNPFTNPEIGGAGLSFSLAPGPVTGQGQVEPTPLGSRHRHSIEATAPESAKTEMTSFSQKFMFTRDDNGTDPTAVFINGILDGLLQADGGGRASALGKMELLAQDGSFINSIERLAFADSNSSNGTFVIENVDERFGLYEMLIPGNIYELRTSLQLVADPRSGGFAKADFSNTFIVELSGVANTIPEPSSLVLIGLGYIAWCFGVNSSRTSIGAKERLN